MKNLPLLISLVIIAGTVIILNPRVTHTQIKYQSKLPTIFIENISTNNIVYHSAELMKLNISIYSTSNLQKAVVKVSGINGRLNEEKIVNLKEGINEVYFNYQLPRCNVCGGIKAGDYEINCEVSYRNLTSEKSIKINIQQ